MYIYIYLKCIYINLNMCTYLYMCIYITNIAKSAFIIFYLLIFPKHYI